MNVAELFVPATFGAYHGSILYVSVACSAKCKPEIHAKIHVTRFRNNSGNCDLWLSKL